MPESNQLSGDWPAVPSMARRTGDKCWCDDPEFPTCARDCEIRRERDRYREALETFAVEVECEVAGCASDGEAHELCGTCREILKPWAERAREVLR